MFEEGQRSIHRDIPPAKDRICEYRTKNLKARVQSAIDQRPMSGITSMNG